jgi:hypothetical protein
VVCDGLEVVWQCVPLFDCIDCMVWGVFGDGKVVRVVQACVVCMCLADVCIYLVMVRSM